MARWRYAPEKRGMKGSRSKTENKTVDQRETGGKLNMEGVEIVKIDVFKCLRSTMESQEHRQGGVGGDECSEACCHVRFTDGVRSLKYSPQSKSSFVLPTTSYISHLLIWIQNHPLKCGKMLQMYIFLAEFPRLNLPSCSFAVSESNALMWLTYINMPQTHTHSLLSQRPHSF